MIRNIDLIASQKNTVPLQLRRAGKLRFLRSKDLIRAFSSPGVVLGQNASGCYIFKATMNKGHGDITILLLTSADPTLVKTAVESIFLHSEEPCPAKLAPGEVDMRQFADGVFSGGWHVFEDEEFSFLFLADAGYQIQLTEIEALQTFAKILEIQKAVRRCRTH